MSLDGLKIVLNDSLKFKMFEDSPKRVAMVRGEFSVAKNILTLFSNKLIFNHLKCVITSTRPPDNVSISHDSPNPILPCVWKMRSYFARLAVKSEN